MKAVNQNREKHLKYNCLHALPNKISYTNKCLYLLLHTSCQKQEYDLCLLGTLLNEKKKKRRSGDQSGRLHK